MQHPPVFTLLIASFSEFRNTHYDFINARRLGVEMCTQSHLLFFKLYMHYLSDFMENSIQNVSIKVYWRIEEEWYTTESIYLLHCTSLMELTSHM